MSKFRIFKEVLEILFGLGCIGVGIAFQAEEPWLYLCGVGLIAWAIWDISKELRDTASEGDIVDMSQEREAISKRLNDQQAA